MVLPDNALVANAYPGTVAASSVPVWLPDGVARDRSCGGGRRLPGDRCGVFGSGLATSGFTLEGATASEHEPFSFNRSGAGPASNRISPDPPLRGARLWWQLRRLSVEE